MSEVERLRKNVFDNLQEIERLNNIIKEVREYIEKQIVYPFEFPNKVFKKMLLVEKKELLKILDKENNET